jgi:hypothetical protein
MELRITNLQTGNSLPDYKFNMELPEDYAYRTFTSGGANTKLHRWDKLRPTRVCRTNPVGIISFLTLKEPSYFWSFVRDGEAIANSAFQQCRRFMRDLLEKAQKF